MANWLEVRRVKVQFLHDDGSYDGDPEYGIYAIDEYEDELSGLHPTLASLEHQIMDEGSMMGLVSGFTDLREGTVGRNNYRGPFVAVESDDG